MAVLMDDSVLDEADLPIIGQTFVGSLQVVEQTRGQIVALQVSDRGRPERILIERRLVLGPDR